MNKLLTGCLILVLSLALAGCGGPKEEAAPQQELSAEEVIGDIQEDEVDLANIGTGWPKEIPQEVPELTGVTFTYVENQTNGKTLMFEGGNKENIRGYADTLEAAGFTGEVLENDFAIDYTGSKGEITIFLNFVPEGLSKLDIRY